MGVEKLIYVIKKTAANTATLALLTGTSLLFSYIISREQVAIQIANWVVGLTDNKYLFLLVINVVFLFLGCVMDVSTIQYVFVPMVLPLVKMFNIDLVHFGVVICLNMMIGLSTPPFGMVLFIVTGIGKTQMSKVIKEILPMVAIMILLLLLCTYIPQIIMFIPNTMGVPSVIAAHTFQIVGNDPSVGDQGIEGAGRIGFQPQVGPCGRLLCIPKQDTDLPVGLHLRPSDIANIKDTVQPQIGQNIVDAQPQPMDGRLEQLPIPDDQYGIAGQQTTKADVILAETRQNDLGRHQGQNGHQSVQQGNVYILQRHRGDSRYQNGDHQFTGLQFAYLPFAHQADGGDDGDIKDQRADKRYQHKIPPFYG